MNRFERLKEFAERAYLAEAVSYEHGLKQIAEDIILALRVCDSARDAEDNGYLLHANIEKALEEFMKEFPE